MQTDKQLIWDKVLQTIKIGVSDAIFKTWISQTYLENLNQNNNRFWAEIACSSAFISETLEKRYFGLIQDTLTNILGLPTDLSFIIRQRPIEANSQELPPPLFQQQETTTQSSSIPVSGIFTFQNFAVSSSNQMAFAAAQAVAEHPSQSYNPLFLWGGVGVGKTHLMHAVANYIKSKNPDARILITTAESLTNDIIEGIRNKTTPAVRSKYRKQDTLFIDDIQFIAGKDKVQEEFFHTFNEVLGASGQVILTSDQPPAEISKLEDRLRSRFEAGLIVDIGPPDFELRCAIIQIKSVQKGIDLPANLVHMIASNFDSARKIEGFLTRLGSEVKINGATLSEELVQGLIGRPENIGQQRAKTSSDDVIDLVCSHYNVSKRAIMGKAKGRLIARPRQVLMYVLRVDLKIPLEEVGRIVGGRDHSTVMHAVKTITNLSSTNSTMREDILKIKTAL